MSYLLYLIIWGKTPDEKVISREYLILKRRGGGGLYYQPSLENGSDQLIVTLYTQSIYPSVHEQLIQTINDVP